MISFDDDITEKVKVDLIRHTLVQLLWEDVWLKITLLCSILSLSTFYAVFDFSIWSLLRGRYSIIWKDRDLRNSKSSSDSSIIGLDQLKYKLALVLCGVVGESSLGESSNNKSLISFSPIYFKVIVHRLKLSTFRRSKASVIWTQETVHWKLIVMKVIRPDWNWHQS